MPRARIQVRSSSMKRTWRKPEPRAKRTRSRAASDRMAALFCFGAAILLTPRQPPAYAYTIARRIATLLAYSRQDGGWKRSSDARCSTGIGYAATGITGDHILCYPPAPLARHAAAQPAAAGHQSQGHCARHIGVGKGAMLSYVGHLVRARRGGTWTAVPRWGMTQRRGVAGVDQRWASVCDTPEQDLLVARCAPRESSDSFAGIRQSRTICAGACGAGDAAAVSERARRCERGC